MTGNLNRLMRVLAAAGLAVASSGMVLSIAIAAFASPSAAAQEADEPETLLRYIAERDALIASQESLLNNYRCMFNIDTNLVPGGCQNGRPIHRPTMPGVFEGTLSQRDIQVRDELVAAQEQLLNVYRCRFGIDTHIVPGRCIEVVPIQAVYAVPTDVDPVAGRESVIAHIVGEVQKWYRSQTGGRHPLFARDGTSISVETVRLAHPQDTYPYDAATEIRLQIDPKAVTPLLVIMEGRMEGRTADDACGWASLWDFGSAYTLENLGRLYAHIPIAHCAHVVSINRGLFSRIAETIAHELGHMLGAVPSCAPNHDTRSAHVDDDHRDLMYIAGISKWGLGSLGSFVLDAGNDDYYLHGRDDCYDISDNPLLVAEPPATPPDPVPTPEVVPFQAVYAVPSDADPVAGRESVIARTVGEMQKWYRSQTGGRHPLFARDGPLISVETVRLPQPLDAIRVNGYGFHFYNEIRRLLRLAPQTPLLIIIENTGSGCGSVQTSQGFTTTCTDLSYQYSYVGIAANLAKILGANLFCAPNFDGGFGVDDDNRDLLYDGPQGQDRGNLILDVGNDDYYLHGRDDCYDIADNPLLAVEPPATTTP